MVVHFEGNRKQVDAVVRKSDRGVKSGMTGQSALPFDPTNDARMPFVQL